MSVKRFIDDACMPLFVALVILALWLTTPFRAQSKLQLREILALVRRLFT